MALRSRVVLPPSSETSNHAALTAYEPIRRDAFKDLSPFTFHLSPFTGLLLAPSSQPASYHLDRPIQISGGVSQAEKSGFELRWCKIDP